MKRWLAEQAFSHQSTNDHQHAGKGNQQGNKTSQLYDDQQRIVKLEDELHVARNAITNLNNRIGDEILDSDDSLLSDDECQFENLVNTREYQRDQFFGQKYFFLTNVSISTEFYTTYENVLQIYTYCVILKRFCLPSHRVMVIGSTWVKHSRLN